MADDKLEAAQKAIEAEIVETLALQKTVASEEAELMLDERFRSFLTRQKEAQERIANVWDIVEAQMTKHDIKSIKGDFGSITLAERTTFEVDVQELEDEYFKRVPDTKKIGTAYTLFGDPPKGTTVRKTKYLVKRIK